MANFNDDESTDPKKPINRQQRERLIKSITRHGAETMDDLPILSEDLFRSSLLPILAGTAPRDEDGHIDVSPWINAAGSPYRRIRVVDSKGEEIFILPGFTRKLPTTTRERGMKGYRNTTNEIFSNANNIAKNAPRKAALFLQEALGSKVPQNKTESERTLAFDSILKRYGYPGMVKDVPAEVKDESNAASSAPVGHHVDFEF